MRIIKLVTQNFRQLENFEIEFPKNSVDLHVIIGKNGAGKSNIMNAINWCLYGDEPHLSIESRGLPLLNLKAIEDSYGENEDVRVEVSVGTDKGGTELVTFIRTVTFKISNDNGKPQEVDTQFIVRTYDNQQNVKILEGEDAKKFVNRFVPRKIREFFFFDGERLDKYFIESTGEKIKQAILEISQIDLVNILETKLITLSKEIAREAGKNNPELDSINNQISKKETELQNIEDLIQEHQKQISISTEKIKEAEEYLQGEPHVEEKEQRRKQLSEKGQEKREWLEEKTISRQNLLMDYGKLLFLYPVIGNSLKIILEKKEKGELPPKIDPYILKESLNNNYCIVCNNMLDINSTQSIASLLKKITLSTKVSHELSSLEIPLQTMSKSCLKYEDKLRLITSEISNLKDELQQIQQDIDSIDRLLSTFSDENKEMIKQMHNDRKEHEELLEFNRVQLQVANIKKQDVEEELGSLELKKEKALKKDEKQKELNAQHEFCQNAISALIMAKNDIMGNIKDMIEAETKKVFTKLVWKQNTFKNIEIDSKYNINVIHRLGYECLGSMSAAERQLLALSFTLALHRVSGFESPLIIDTPVSRVSDDNRSNFAEVLLEVSKEKQTILLFTPDEFSKNVENVFRPKVNSIRTLEPSLDEARTSLGGYQ